jgi:uroporphyrinogen decarboxylase
MAERIASTFLDALAHKETSHTPVWLMRQAGRYMPVYRQLREKHTLLEIVKTPELACEVTLQPINAFNLDAAIIFSDILPLLEGMGLHLEFLKGEGPHLDNPVRSEADVAALRITPPEECMGFTLDAIRLATRELMPRGIPLIGFSGAPFTLASYAIEGGSSRDHRLTKQFMYTQPKAWHSLMSKLATMVGNYLVAQALSGVQALQVFDSWAGSLSPADYRDYVLPYTKQAIDIAKTSGAPVIYFSTGTSGALNVLRELGADAYSIDWRINLSEAWQTLGTHKPLQGNLDPILLFAPWDELKRQAEKILAEANRMSPNGRGFIFNLGHGILPETPEDNVRRLVDFVRDPLQIRV